MDEDAEDLTEFAAALALFLNRFPDWNAYKFDVETSFPDAEIIEGFLPFVHDIADELKDRPEVDRSIPENLEKQIEASEDDLDDALIAAGVFASIGNVLNAVAEKALEAVRWAKLETLDIAKKAWDSSKKALAVGLSGSAAAALDIVITKGATLRILAEKYPDIFGWLEGLLRGIGL